jgi:hypothetical protein
LWDGQLGNVQPLWFTGGSHVYCSKLPVFGYPNLNWGNRSATMFGGDWDDEGMLRAARGNNG